MTGTELRIIILEEQLKVINMLIALEEVKARISKLERKFN